MATPEMGYYISTKLDDDWSARRLPVKKYENMKRVKRSELEEANDGKLYEAIPF